MFKPSLNTSLIPALGASAYCRVDAGEQCLAENGPIPARRSCRIDARDIFVTRISDAHVRFRRGALSTRRRRNESVASLLRSHVGRPTISRETADVHLDDRCKQPLD